MLEEYREAKKRELALELKAKQCVHLAGHQVQGSALPQVVRERASSIPPASTRARDACRLAAQLARTEQAAKRALVETDATARGGAAQKLLDAERAITKLRDENAELHSKLARCDVERDFRGGSGSARGAASVPNSKACCTCACLGAAPQGEEARQRRARGVRRDQEAPGRGAQGPEDHGPQGGWPLAARSGRGRGPWERHDGSGDASGGVSGCCSALAQVGDLERRNALLGRKPEDDFWGEEAGRR